MSRRKKEPPPPRSTAWETYRPQDDLYWKFGGPTIPVEQIPADEYSYANTATHLKPASRATYLAELIEKTEADLAGTVAYYHDLAERGIDALKFAHYQDDDRRQDANPGDWTMVARHVDRHRASAYRTIRMLRNKLAQYQAMLAEIDEESFPLMKKRQP